MSVKEVSGSLNPFLKKEESKEKPVEYRGRDVERIPQGASSSVDSITSTATLRLTEKEQECIDAGYTLQEVQEYRDTGRSLWDYVIKCDDKVVKLGPPPDLEW